MQTDEWHTVTTNPHKHAHPPAHPHVHADADAESAARVRIQRLAWFLEAHFGDVELHMPDDVEADAAADEPGSGEPALLVTLDEADAVINLLSMVRAFLVSAVPGPKG